MSMFIIIFEDGVVKSSPNVDADILNAAEDGLIQVLDISDQDCIQEYSGGWHTIDGVGE